MGNPKSIDSATYTVMPGRRDTYDVVVMVDGIDRYVLDALVQELKVLSAGRCQEINPRDFVDRMRGRMRDDRWEPAPPREKWADEMQQRWSPEVIEVMRMMEETDPEKLATMKTARQRQATIAAEAARLAEVERVAREDLEQQQATEAAVSPAKRLLIL